MPFARIDLVQGKSADYRRTIADVVYEAMVAILKAPENDRFQVVCEHPPENHIAADSYLGITHTKNIVFIQLTLIFLIVVVGHDNFHLTPPLHKLLGRHPGRPLHA